MKMVEAVFAVTRPVDFFEGCWNVLEKQGRIRPVKLAGLPVASFMSGWRPKFLVDFGLSVFLLELVHDNGQAATWFLDDDYEHITDRVGLLRTGTQDELMQTLSQQIKSVYDDALQATKLVIDEDRSLFKLINENTIRQFVDLFLEKSKHSVQVVENQTFGRQTILLSNTTEFLTFDYLDAIFVADLRQITEAALRDGYLVCPSPVDGVQLRSCQSLVIHEHRMAFRFVDPVHNFVFYLSTTHHPTKIADLYIPAANTVFTTLPEDARTPHSRLVAEYLTHFVAHHRKICLYVQTSRHTPAVVCRGFPGMHIGHQLWNELTAYERLVRTLDRDRLPVIIVPNADRGSEAYGPMDKLFPEWEGKVDRSLRMSSESLAEFVYRRSYLLFRALDHYVTVGLSDRLVQLAHSVPTTSASRTRVAELRAQGFTFVTLGLRVENRTAVNLYDVLERTINHLAKKLPKLAVIIDGHNSRLNGDLATAFDSFGQPGSANPILTELQLAIRLRQRFEYSEIQIVNTVGDSVLDSIVWTKASAFFVAIWGASLAKYRWACNKIGLVISSQSNLTSRHDLHIYDSPEFQENPAPILYIDPTAVTDRPEVPVLFSPVNPVPASYANFQVDCAKLIPQLDRLLEMAEAERAPTLLEYAFDPS